MLLVNCSRPGLRQSDGVGSLTQYLQDLNLPVQTVFLDDLTPEHLRGIPGVILTGSPLYLTQEQDLLEQKAFLKDCSVPLFGICFGHQLIGALHGARVGDYGTTLKGPRTVRFVEKIHPFCFFDQETTFDQEHRQYLKELPPGFKLLATSKECDIEGMFHKEKKIFTTQFHPERYDETLKPLFKDFIDLCFEHNKK